MATIGRLGALDETCQAPAFPKTLQTPQRGIAMKNVTVMVILLGTISSCFLELPQFLAQGCQDGESLVAGYKKDLTGLVDIARKESQSDFDKAYHQKACLSKLGFCLTMVNELLSCMEKASADPAT